MPRPSTPTTSTKTRRPGTPGTASGASSGSSFTGGELNAAAEQFAAACARPGSDVTTLVGFDRALKDTAAAMHTLCGGLTVRARLFEESMPDEAGGHEQFGQLASDMQRLAAAAEALVLDQTRRNAEDWERIRNGRKNERGYDWATNQE